MPMNTFFVNFDITSQKFDKTTDESNSSYKETTPSKTTIVILGDSMLMHINSWEIAKFL